jgi:hypothetical protein
MAAVVRIVGESHSGATPPLIAIQDRAATLQLFQPNFCKLNWSCFEPSGLAWTFDGPDYIERLKGLEPRQLANL